MPGRCTHISVNLAASMLTRETMSITLPHRKKAAAGGDCCHLFGLLELDYG